ncbi:hypothetical protein V6N13_091017 [Hibiscus sabdariffa]
MEVRGWYSTVMQRGGWSIEGSVRVDNGCKLDSGMVPFLSYGDVEQMMVRSNEGDDGESPMVEGYRNHSEDE